MIPMGSCNGSFMAASMRPQSIGKTLLRRHDEGGAHFDGLPGASASGMGKARSTALSMLSIQGVSI
jgi:hypothetical protein